MKRRYFPIVTFVASFALCGPAPAADWTGVWVIADSPMDTQDSSTTFGPGRANPGSQAAQADFFANQPALTPEYLAKQQARLKAVAEAEKAGKYLDVASAECKPVGMPRFWFGPYAFEIIQSPTQINLYQEAWQQTRRVYLDGRGHPSPDEADPEYLGHSIGHWDGGTLVIDTEQFSGSTMTFFGAEHSDAMRIGERITETEPGLIDVEVTVEDPKALVKPWVSHYRLRRKPGMEAGDYVCENNRNPVAEDGSTTTKLGGSR